MDDIVNDSPSPVTNPDTLVPNASARRVQRVRFELRRRDGRVTRVERPTPGFARVTVQGADFQSLRTLSFDDHVKLMLPQPDGSMAMRDLTPRAHDPDRGELVLEVALHGHGPASRWAAAATVGDPVTIGGPRGSMIIPMDYDWHLLAGDASALPAIARRLEELPAGRRVRVLVQADAADWRPLPSASPLQMQWVEMADDWLRALADTPLPPGDGFVWCAGEAQQMARARALLRDTHAHPREAMRVAAYWKRGATAFHEHLDD